MFLPPPNRPTIPEISEPSPPIPPKPPLNVLAIPPDAVCFSKLVHSLPECEAEVVLLEGVPNLMLVDLPVLLTDNDRASVERLGLGVFSVEPVTRVNKVFGGRDFGGPGKLFLDFATLILQFPRLL